MSEAQSGSAILEDIEEHTFIRFCQFAYTGDYDAAEPEIILDSSAIDATGCENGVQEAEPAEPPLESLEIEAEPPAPDPEPEPVPEAEPVTDPWPEPEPEPENDLFDDCLWNSKTKKKGKKNIAKIADSSVSQGPAPAGRSRTSNLWKTFNATAYGRSVVRFKPRTNTEKHEEFTRVFLCHAQLYVFADKYDIASLRELSLFKLHKTLLTFSLYPERVSDIVELIRYTCANTADGPHEKDELKRMMICYAACVIEDLAVDEGFQNLLEEPGTISREIILQMLRRFPVA